MPDILHRVQVASSPAKAYQLLATTEGLSRWWTTDTKGNASADGGMIAFRFGDRGHFDMKVLALEPAKRVQWQVVDGPEEWIGTKISFELSSDGKHTAILFKHEDWRKPVEFMHHCSTKWAIFLMSIKTLLETGKGAPYPDDVHITCTDD